MLLFLYSKKGPQGPFFIQQNFKKGISNMKKTTALFLALSLLLLVSGAFAANPIAVGITAIDYQTGAVIGPKNYSVNELFTVRVTVSIPRFTDTSNLTVKLRTDGLTLFEPQIDL